MSNQSVPENGEGGRQPVFLMPGAVTALICILIAIHFASGLVFDIEGYDNFLLWFGFIPFRFTVPHLLPGGTLPLWWTGFTHALLHVDWMHLTMNGAWLAVFGTPVARRYGAAAFLIVFFVGALAGALALAIFQLAFVNQFAVLVGASGGVAALTGAAMRFVFQPPIIHRDPETGQVVILGRRTATLREVIANPRSRAFILFWVGLNLLIPLAPVFLNMTLPIAWEAHIGGFIVGLFLPGLFDRRLKAQR